MTAKEFREALKHLGLSQAQVSRVTGIAERNVRLWAQHGARGNTSTLLRLWFSGKISAKDIEKARD